VTVIVDKVCRSHYSQEERRSPAVVQTADRTAYNTLINDHLDNNSLLSHVRDNANKIKIKLNASKKASYNK